MLRAALAMDGPVALRYPRGGEGHPFPDWDGGPAAVPRRGTDVTLVSYGTLIDEVLAAADLLAGRGVSAEVVKLHTIAPLDTETVLTSLRSTGRLLVLEDCFENGSVGQRLAAAAAQAGVPARAVILKNLGSRFAGQGTIAQLRRQAGLDAASVADAVLEQVEGRPFS